MTTDGQLETALRPPTEGMAATMNKYQLPDSSIHYLGRAARVLSEGVTASTARDWAELLRAIAARLDAEVNETQVIVERGL